MTTQITPTQADATSETSPRDDPRRGRADVSPWLIGAVPLIGGVLTFLLVELLDRPAAGLGPAFVVGRVLATLVALAGLWSVVRALETLAARRA